MNYDPNTGQPITTTSNQTNGFAIAGLICSILVGSITGIIFSAIGLSTAKKIGTGKGMSIAGIVISIVRIAIIAFFILAIYVIWPTQRTTILNSARCSEAYDCRDLGDGNLSCKYIKEDNTIGTVTCPNYNSSGSTTKAAKTTKEVTTTTKSIDENKEPINVYVFYGSGCPHCEDLFDYLNRLSYDSQYGKMFKVVKYEVWYNKSNEALMNKTYKQFGIKEGNGVPFYVIGDQYFTGFPSDVEQQESSGIKIKFAINKSYTDPSYIDVVKSLE